MHLFDGSDAIVRAFAELTSVWDQAEAEGAGRRVRMRKAAFDLLLAFAVAGYVPVFCVIAFCHLTAFAVLVLTARSSAAD